MEAVKMYVIFFFLYSAIGWLGESFYCSFPVRKWINRGFLTGPMCPIYGTGTVTLVLCLGKLCKMDIRLPIGENGLLITPVIIFFAGIVLCDIVEFITSVLLEKLFHARWWDYSNKPFNIQGRICLGHSFYWGIGSVVFLYFIHPFVDQLIERVPRDNIHIILGAILGIFLVDLFHAIKTAADIKKFLDKIRGIGDSITQFADGVKQNFDGKKETVSQKYSAFAEKVSANMKDETEQYIRDLIVSAEIENKSSMKRKDRKKAKSIYRLFRNHPEFQKAVREKYDVAEEKLSELKSKIPGDDETE